jgi:multidrug efflux pump subunit AcrA (membrane-fusion protein)
MHCSFERTKRRPWSLRRFSTRRSTSSAEGFEGASTREIARASGTAMSSITYHFGGKHGLYLAAADHIAASIREMQGPRMSPRRRRRARIARSGDGGARDDARQLAQMMLRPETESWSRFIIREQQFPTEAFDLLFEGAMQPILEAFIELIGAPVPISPAARQWRPAILLFGQAMMLRAGRAAVCRALQVDQIDAHCPPAAREAACQRALHPFGEAAMNRRRHDHDRLIVVLAVAAFATAASACSAPRRNRADALRQCRYPRSRHGFRVGGRIAGIGVEEGAKVTQGQLLATLDTATLDSRIAEADARLAQAQAQFDKRGTAHAHRISARPAPESPRRRRSMPMPSATMPGASRWSNPARSAAISGNRPLRSRPRRARSLPRRSRGCRCSRPAAGRRISPPPQPMSAPRRPRAQASATDLGDTRLVAATDGTVVTRAREPGAIVQPGETVLTLSIDRPMRVRAYVAETDLSRISPGMKVRSPPTAMPRPIAARSAISRRARSSPQIGRDRESAHRSRLSAPRHRRRSRRRAAPGPAGDGRVIGARVRHEG